MKKVFLPLLLLTLPLSAQPNHFKSAEYFTRFKEVISDAKELVKAHPYISLSVGVASAAAIYWYSQREEEDVSVADFYDRGAPMERGELRQPGWYKIKRSPEMEPLASPKPVSPEFKDFTGDFPSKGLPVLPLSYSSSESSLHPQELRHK